MSGRRSNGEGSISRDRNGWRGRIVIDGQRRSVSGKTKQEVIEKLNALRAESYMGMYVRKNSLTVEEWVRAWLKRYVEPKVTESTLKGYTAMFNNHIIPVFGHLNLQNLSKPILEEGYAAMFQKNLKHKDATYSHSTANAVAVQFKKCLEEAVANGLIPKNPHIGVHLHKLRPAKKVEAYTAAEQKIIVDHLKQSDDLRQIYFFLISTGLRIGEASALTWDDIDFENRTVNINKTVVEISGNPQIEDRTKTPSGTRKIALSAKVLDVLEGLHHRQNERLNIRNLVFPSNVYTIRTQANLRTMWAKECEKMGVPYKGLHALRHTWATRALECGIDVKTVSVMLGHKNVVTTMNIYQDSLQDHQLDSIDKLDRFL